MNINIESTTIYSFGILLLERALIKAINVIKTIVTTLEAINAKGHVCQLV
jgi:hypothetical protein